MLNESLTYQVSNNPQFAGQSGKEESHLDDCTCILLPVLANLRMYAYRVKKIEDSNINYT